MARIAGKAEKPAAAVGQKKSAFPLPKKGGEKRSGPDTIQGDVPKARLALSRMLKNRASHRDPALNGYCKCSHMTEYATLSKTPHALADGL